MFSAGRCLAAAVCLSLLGSVPSLAATIDLADSGTPTSRLVADMEAIALARQGHTVNRTSIPTASEAAAKLADGAIDAYVAEGSDFLVMKLVPGQGVDSMRPVRVTSPGAGLTLPLRMG